MNGFSTIPLMQQNLMRIVISNQFCAPDWTAISNTFRAFAGEGVTNWELDLRDAATLDSLALGSIVALNTAVNSRRGSFRILARKGSEVAKLLKATKLSIIVNVLENNIQ